MTVNTMIRISCLSFVAIIAIVKNFISLNAVAGEDFLAITVATHGNDALERYKKSAESFNIPYEIFGLGQEWLGGDIKHKPGGGHKVKIIREGLKKYKDQDDLIIMFTDSYDVVFQNTSEAIVEKFKEKNAKVLFSAEGFCWPVESLKEKYPEVSETEKRFLNSGGFIGYASYLYRLTNHREIDNEDDDQLYYTEIFLNETLRNEFQMKLDTKSEIFINLNGVLGTDEISLNFKNNVGYLKNTLSNTIPVVVHANGPTKIAFNSMTNYIGHNWNPTEGCQQCKQNKLNLETKSIEEHPRISLSLFIDVPTPFLDEFFERVQELTYEKSKIDVTIYCLVDLHLKRCEEFVYKNVNSYNSINLFDQTIFPTHISARNDIITRSIQVNNDFLFVVDSIVQLTNKDTIQLLANQNKSVLAPLITRRNQFWSNFWGALSDEGYYARSNDYMEIVKDIRKGIWNVPFVNSAYMIERNTLHNLVNAYGMSMNNIVDTDINFCEHIREKNIFMYVDNQNSYGYQVSAEGYQTSHLHNDLWEIFSNPLDWEEKYIHPDYKEVVSTQIAMQDVAQPCPDVFWFPLMSKTFCKQMIEEMEHYGKWSDGSNTDSRLEGGYENVPTRDIHMRQVEWEPHWIHVLQTYVYPMQKKLFDGYDDLPSARMNFVVRYRPDEQPTLRPHHDASSYSLNVALNVPGEDYQGGGTRFLRYDCQLTQSKLGWVLIHPGRITHLHEGLRTTNGTRYIFVTFVNP